MLVAYYAWLCFVYIYITTAVGGWASHAVTRGLCRSQGTRHQRLFPAVLASPHNPGLRQKAPVRPQHTGPAVLGPVGPAGPVEPAGIRWFWWIFGTPPQYAVFEFCTIILNTTGQDTLQWAQCVGHHSGMHSSGHSEGQAKGHDPRHVRSRLPYAMVSCVWSVYDCSVKLLCLLIYKRWVESCIIIFYVQKKVCKMMSLCE